MKKTSLLSGLSDEIVEWLVNRLNIVGNGESESFVSVRQHVYVVLNQTTKLDLKRNNPQHQALINDVAFLAGFTQLESLNLGNQAVSDLSPLTGLYNLKSLRAYYTSVSDLSPLSELRQLALLDVDHTHIEDVSPLAHVMSLTYLSLCGTTVSDLSSLSNLPLLTSLDIRHTNVKDLSPLISLKTLERLALDGTKQQDITLLTQNNFPQLRDLTIFYDDYYPPEQPIAEKLKQLKQQLPDCSIGMTGLY